MADSAEPKRIEALPVNNANREPGPNPEAAGLGSSTGSWPKLSSEGADSPTIVSGRASAAAGELANALPHVGDRIDAFVIRSALGSGGMGAVYLADDTRLDRPVALKILPPDHARDYDAVETFYLEGRAVARLHHENTAGVSALGGPGY